MTLIRKIMAVTLVVMTTLYAGSSRAAEYITNGGFESGLSGWSCLGANYCSSTSFNVNSGSLSMVGYDNSDYATLSQTISTTIGSSYDFSFYSIATQVYGNLLGYSFSGFSNAVFVPTTISWLHTTDSFIASADSTNIQFYFSTRSGTGTWRIDDVSVQDVPMAPVPEPQTYAMMLLGLGLLGLSARRRRDDFA